MAKENNVIETVEEEIDSLVPQMNISPPTIIPEEKCLIEDDALLGVYDEIMTDLRKDRKQTSYLINRFADMVVNGDDSSTSSKEALVNLMKLKTETADKMSKIADLMTRIKLKQPDTYKPYLTAKQENNTTINIAANKRELLKKIQKRAINKKGKDDE